MFSIRGWKLSPAVFHRIHPFFINDTRKIPKVKGRKAIDF